MVILPQYLYVTKKSPEQKLFYVTKSTKIAIKTIDNKLSPLFQRILSIKKLHTNYTECFSFHTVRFKKALNTQNQTQKTKM